MVFRTAKTSAIHTLISLLLVVAVFPASAQVTWTKSTAPTKQDLTGVTFGDGTFIAVGMGDTILTSTDAVSWTVRTSTLTEPLMNVTWGSDQFVAVGKNGTVLISPDGTEWYEQPSGTTAQLNAITYGHNLYVAAGEEGTIITSPDATDWTIRATGVTRSFDDVVCADSTFVAVGDSAIIYTSHSGETWTARASTLPDGVTLIDYYLRGVVWDGTKFLAQGQNEQGSGEQGIVDTSSGGSGWKMAGALKEGGMEFSDWQMGLLFANETYVSVGQSGQIYTSADGFTWKNQQKEGYEDLNAVTFGNGIYVTVGTSGAVYSSPSITAVNVPVPKTVSNQKITVSNGMVRYRLNDAARVSICLYDMNGQRVKTLVDKAQIGGEYEVALPANLARGGYVLSFRAKGMKIDKRVVVVE